MHGARIRSGRRSHDDADHPHAADEKGERVGVIEKLDFLVRFWELEARNATLGQPLSSAEQVELLSLMQLVTGDQKMPAAGPVARTRSALPAQVIGDGTIKAVEIRSVSASAILVAGTSSMSVGAQVIVRAADAVSGVEYALPCRVIWAYAGPRAPWRSSWTACRRAPISRRRPPPTRTARSAWGARSGSSAETGNHVHFARRSPAICQRACGGKKLRYVARTCERGVKHEPPRSTIWLHMNLPLYSPSAPGSGA